jgi:Spo0E like sporulation regulatory protein.
MTKLRNNIESLRDKLCCLLLNKKPTDTEVVKCSQELDKLILEYEKKVLKGEDLKH